MILFVRTNKSFGVNDSESTNIDTPIDLKWIPAKHHQSSLEYEKEYGVLPGKGALIIGELEKTSRARKVWHDYNCVYVFK